MSKAITHKPKQIIAEINITPLTDVFLVLLTIMMIVAPFLRQISSDLHLPEITAGTETNGNETTLEVTKEGRYFLDGIGIAESELDRLLALKAESAKNLVIQADRDARSGAVLRVFRAAESAAYGQVTLLGQAATTPEPPQDKKNDPSPP